MRKEHKKKKKRNTHIEITPQSGLILASEMTMMSLAGGIGDVDVQLVQRNRIKNKPHLFMPVKPGVRRDFGEIRERLQSSARVSHHEGLETDETLKNIAKLSKKKKKYQA